MAMAMLTPLLVTPRNAKQEPSTRDASLRSSRQHVRGRASAGIMNAPADDWNVKNTGVEFYDCVRQPGHGTNGDTVRAEIRIN